MRVVIRADASHAVGTGHVMRCLTLAHALQECGSEVHFLCREAAGHLCDWINESGFAVSRLHADSGQGADFCRRDAEQSRKIIRSLGAPPDWLVVDHYELDQEWEHALRVNVGRIMVIDDLANRRHDCDLLLDQNVDNSRQQRYRQLIPPVAQLLLGTQYAMTRTEFVRQRVSALARRAGEVTRVLVSMGGADPADDTSKALAGLAEVRDRCSSIDVVIGPASPHRAAIEARCANLTGVELHVQTRRMAELMARADVAIGGGGSTSWERCTLGLPALVTIQSRDQEEIAVALERTGVQRVVGSSAQVGAGDYRDAVRGLTPEALLAMSRRGAALCDGRGAERVVVQMGAAG